MLLVLILLTSEQSSAGIVTFEYLPDNVTQLAEGDDVIDQWSSEGMIFSSGLSGPLLVEKGGNSLFAFINGPTQEFDTLMPGEGYLGNAETRYIRPRGGNPLAVDFLSDVAFVSFDLIDVDGDQEWLLEIFDSNNQLLEMELVDTNSPGMGDALAGTFSFSRNSADIAQLVLTPNHFGGTAVDSFITSTTPIPEPGSMVLLGCYCLPLSRKRKRVKL